VASAQGTPKLRSKKETEESRGQEREDGRTSNQTKDNLLPFRSEDAPMGHGREEIGDSQYEGGNLQERRTNTSDFT
jgi:hypothetical protein